MISKIELSGTTGNIDYFIFIFLVSLISNVAIYRCHSRNFNQLSCMLLNYLFIYLNVCLVTV